MHAIRYLAQFFRAKNGLRLLIVVIFSVLMSQFFVSGQDVNIFIGMFRISDDPATPGLLYNMYPMMFMVCAVALTLEQPSEYLSVSNALVYVRASRGLVHFLRYIGILIGYCTAIGVLVCFVTSLVVKDVDIMTLTSTAVSAVWTLLILLLASNLGYLWGNRAIGYFAAIIIYTVLLSAVPVQRWFLASSGIMPNWCFALTISAVALVAANYQAFRYIEIL